MACNLKWAMKFCFIVRRIIKLMGAFEKAVSTKTPILSESKIVMQLKKAMSCKLSIDIELI